jgi:hypothetical protein
MDTSRRPADELLEVARVLLLLQGSILVATTIEALIWGAIFAGATGSPALMSGVSAALVFVARVRLRADRRWTRRLVYAIEGLTVATLAIDSVLAILLAGALPPAVALLTQLVLPLSVITLVRRSARAAAAPILLTTTAVLERAS